MKPLEIIGRAALIIPLLLVSTILALFWREDVENL